MLGGFLVDVRSPLQIEVSNVPVCHFWTETCVVDLLVNPVTNHISSSFCPGTQGTLWVLCNVLASFLRGSRGGTLYGVGNIVGSVPIGSASEDF